MKKRNFRFFSFRLEYAVFGHKPQQRFTNYADVRAEIESDTKNVVRDDMGVSNIPINLTIYSPHGKNETKKKCSNSFAFAFQSLI